MDAQWEAAIVRLGWSTADIVKLHVATTLAVCAALDSCGSPISRRVATNLRHQIRQNGGGAWSMITSAMAELLDDAVPPTASNDNAAARCSV